MEISVQYHSSTGSSNSHSSSRRGGAGSGGGGGSKAAAGAAAAEAVVVMVVMECVYIYRERESENCQHIEPMFLQAGKHCSIGGLLV